MHIHTFRLVEQLADKAPFRSHYASVLNVGPCRLCMQGYSFKSSKYLARVFSRFRGSALTDEEYQAALQDLVKGLNESRCKSLSHPKVRKTAQLKQG